MGWAIEFGPGWGEESADRVARTVGTWTTIKFSGAIPASERNQLLERVRKLSDAVKAAREEANSIEAEKKKTGGTILDYIFRGA